jgi:hypothetical protein
MTLEKIEKPGKKLSVIYKVTIGAKSTPLEVFPETLEELINREIYLPDPVELSEAIKQQFKKDEEARVTYEFNISHDLESYRVIITINVGNDIWIHETSMKNLIPELKTQLKYAVKIMELDKMIDDLFELLNLYRINEEPEDD